MSGWLQASVLVASLVPLGLMLTLRTAAAQDGTPGSLPPAPAAPTVYDAGLHALTVTWTEPDGADPAITGYDLEYRRRDAADWLSGPQQQSGTSATITGLEPDKNYYVRVRARNGNGAGEWSEAGEGTTALYVGTMTTGDGSDYRGYRRFRGEPYGGPNSLGELVPRALTYDGDEHQIITMAWCICVRYGVDGRQTTAVDLYSLFHEIPDEWVLRVGDLRLPLSDARRADFARLGLKAWWPHISPGWETGRQYEVSFSRNPLLSSSGRGVIRGPLTAELRGVPGVHDGRSAFQFTLRFSEDVTSRREDVRGAVLTVAGGSISDASQLNEPSHREWRVTVRPSGAGAVSVTLQADRECGTPGAVCTGDGRRLSRTVTATVAGPQPPVITGETQASVAENDAGAVARFNASDLDTRRLTWLSPAGVDGAVFTMDGSGALRFLRAPDFEAPADADADNVYEVTVRVSDGLQVATHDVTVAVSDRNERPMALDDEARTREDEPVTIDVLANDVDPDAGDVLTPRVVAAGNGAASVESDGTVVFTPARDHHGAGRLSYEIADSQGLTATATVRIDIEPVNDPPRFPGATASRAVPELAGEGDGAGPPLTATDIEGDSLTYRISGAAEFTIDAGSGQIRVAPGAVFDAAARESYVVRVEVDDGNGGSAGVDVTITVTPAPGAFRSGGPDGPARGATGEAPATTPGGGGGGGGGGGPSGPTPSAEDFEWTVKEDIEALDPGHGTPTGMWSDGQTLWLLENGSGADDAVYAYDLGTGERAPGREFALDERNRAPRGIWSDRETAWVSDSGRERLFAHDLGSGERLPERDIELVRENRDARGIWSGGGTMWVLDGGRDSLFAYDLTTGDLLAGYALDAANGDPHGLWSDGATVWVSNHEPKRLFAYRLPAVPDEPPDEPEPLERVRDEDFTELSRASNNSPRGVWSDGAVMYVADALDARVYSYNMPDAIDARLASLTIEGVDIGGFDPAATEYEGVPGDGVTRTTVTAEAAQPGAMVAIAPADADEEAAGHQVVLAGTEAITLTVTSPDGSRTRSYRVRLPSAPERPGCLRGAVSAGFSLVVYGGGSLGDLVECARTRGVTALYTLSGGEYVSYLVDAPEVANQPFRDLFPGGVRGLLPLVVRSEAPPGDEAPPPSAPAATEPFPACLLGEIGEGFSLAVYEGGSVAQLEACAERLGVAAVYALAGGEYVALIPGAPEFVNGPFRDLFAEGVPAVTPLAVWAAGQGR